MTALRLDPAVRRRRLYLRVSVLKRRVGLASALGFGALFGLVAQHAVGTQKHSATSPGQAAATARSASTFFDASGAGYSFDDSGIRAAQQSSVTSSDQAAQQPAPIAQSSGS